MPRRGEKSAADEFRDRKVRYDGRASDVKKRA